MNLPNIITLFRLFLVPVYLVVFYSNLESRYLFAMFIYLIAGISDVVDGHIARSRNLVTKLGTVLDPLADKIMAITVLVTFTSTGSIPKWILIIFIAKELTMILVSTIFYFNKYKLSIPANFYGKAGTLLLYLTIFSIALGIPYLESYLIYLTVIVNVLAFIIYSKEMIKSIMSLKNNKS